MHKFFGLSLFSISLLFASMTLPGTLNAASVVAKIDVSQQMMRVYVNGYHKYSWRVSTGRRGYYTPRGRYRPTVLKRMHYSSKYNNSPMPYSIFFRGGYAIHGTNYISRLGRPASHGCVRLHPSAARTLYSLVRRNRGSTRIVVTNQAQTSQNEHTFLAEMLNHGAQSACLRQGFGTDSVPLNSSFSPCRLMTCHPVRHCCGKS